MADSQTRCLTLPAEAASRRRASPERPRESAGSSAASPSAAPGSWLWSRLLLRLLDRLESGRLRVRFPSRRGTRTVWLTGDRDARGEAELTVRRPGALLAALLARGSLGFAESYIDGHWRSADLTALLRLLARNRARYEALSEGTWAARWVARLRHALNRNSRAGSRRNIAAHYDLGNAFYRRWLDAGMTYSAGLYAAPEPDPAAPAAARVAQPTDAEADALADAQERKYERILELLDARPGQHLLEIGCGWGGFAEFAARWGLKVTGITLSREQLAHARRRVAAAGVADRVDLRLMDYRDLPELGRRFDHVVSIEMFEAVGEAWWGRYFELVRDCLRPGGSAVLQVITIAGERFERYRRVPDFIQRHVFPGGMLPSVEAFNRSAFASGLDITDQDFFAADYARTLADWRRRFEGAEAAIAGLGYDARFRRLWRYYLAYCEAGFREGLTDLMQVRLVHPDQDDSLCGEPCVHAVTTHHGCAEEGSS